MNDEQQPGRSYGWIRSSGQLWKYWAFQALLGVAAILFLTGMWVIQSGDDGLAPMFASVGVGSCALSWLLLAVRCPVCGKRCIYRTLRTEDAATVWDSVLFDETPPCCKGSAGAESSGAEKPADK